MFADDSKVGGMMKDALQGAGIGYAVGNLWGALIGAIAEPLVKEISKGTEGSLLISTSSIRKSIQTRRMSIRSRVRQSLD